MRIPLSLLIVRLVLIETNLVYFAPHLCLDLAFLCWRMLDPRGRVLMYSVIRCFSGCSDLNLKSLTETCRQAS